MSWQTEHVMPIVTTNPFEWFSNRIIWIKYANPTCPAVKMTDMKLERFFT